MTLLSSGSVRLSARLFRTCPALETVDLSRCRWIDADPLAFKGMPESAQVLLPADLDGLSHIRALLSER